MTCSELPGPRQPARPQLPSLLFPYRLVNTAGDPAPRSPKLTPEVSWNERFEDFLDDYSDFMATVPIEVKDFAAGTVGGSAQVIAGHPLDLIKVRMQCSTSGASAWSVAKQTLATEGPRAFFKGMAPPLAGVGAVNAVLFFAYGRARDWIEPDRSKELTIPQATLAGAFAGFVNCAVICPVELVKSRLQIQEVQARFNGPMDCTRYIVRTEGVRGLFKGMMATVYREIPAYAGYFGCYESAKRLLLRSKQRNTPLELFVAGGIGGVGCWIFSYPQDVVKTNIQIADGRPYKPIKWLADGGFWRCAVHIARTEGWRGFWKGFSPTIVRAFWANAATFFSYEMAMKAFTWEREEDVSDEDIEEDIETAFQEHEV